MASTTAAQADTAQPRLKQKYRSEIAPQLKSDLGLTNVHQIPGSRRSS